MHQYVPYVVLASVLLLSMLMTHNHAVNLTTYRSMLDEMKKHVSDTMASRNDTPDSASVGVSVIRNEFSRLEHGISDLYSRLDAVSDRLNNEQTLQFVAENIGAAFLLSQYEMESKLSDFMYNRGYVLGFKFLAVSHPDLHKALCPYVVEYLKSQLSDVSSLKRVAESDLDLYVLGGDLKW